MEIVNASEKTPDKKNQGAKRKSVLKKLDLESAKILANLKERANKKTFGRKVTDSEILGAAIRLLGADQIRELQESTYSERDRLQMAHEEFQKGNGRISLDQFIGKLLKGEIVLRK